MASYLKILLFGLLFLTSCATYRNKPLTFISDQDLDFRFPEDSLKAKLRIIDSVVYQNNGSFIIGRQYRSIKFRGDRMYNKIYNTYYFTGKHNAYADIVVLYFYKKRLSKIRLTTRQPERIDSLLTATEIFYNQKFETFYRGQVTHNDSLRYGKYYRQFLDKPALEYGNFTQDKITASYIRNLVYQEITLTLTNAKVKLPDWCGTRYTWRSLLMDLRFWRYFW
jgi:hypothetical protein